MGSAGGRRDEGHAVGEGVWDPDFHVLAPEPAALTRRRMRVGEAGDVNGGRRGGAALAAVAGQIGRAELREHFGRYDGLCMREGKCKRQFKV